MKILLFHNTLPEYRIEWFKELDKIADIDFVFTNEGLNRKDYGFDIIYDRVKDLKLTFLEDGIEGYKKLKGILSHISNYDFVELPAIDSFREYRMSRKILKAAKKSKVKIGYFWEKWEAPVSFQPISRKVKNRILRIVPKIVYKKVDILFSPGKKNREYFISNGINEDIISFIPNVSETPKCDFIDLKEEYKIRRDYNIILFLGRLMPQKGVRTLIEAYSKVKEINDKVFLIIAGDGEDMATCKNLVKTLNIKDVVFVGAVDPQKRGVFFEQCDVFVYPVIYYGGWVDVWGLTINEAIQHNKMVVTTDAVGSAYELIEEDVNGYRIEPGNIDMLCDSILKSLEKNKENKKTQKNNQILSIYNFKNMAKSYVDDIYRLLQMEGE